MDSEMEKLQSEFTPGGRRRSLRGCRVKKEPEVKKVEIVAKKRRQGKGKTKKTSPVAKKTKRQRIEPVEKEPTSESDLSDLENSEDEWKSPSKKALARIVESDSSTDDDNEQEQAKEQRVQLVEEMKKLKRPQPRKKKQTRKKMTKKVRRVLESDDEEAEQEEDDDDDEEEVTLTSEEWNDVEINQLTDALESMRKKGHTLGLYGLNDQQATWIYKQHVPTKSIRQIKRIVFANVNEHILTTHEEPIDAWADLFQFLYTEDAHKQAKEALNAHLQDRARFHRLESTKTPTAEDGIERANLENIYKYCGALLMQDDKPQLTDADVICLLNALENIEKQATILTSKELTDLLNSRYAALLGNRKKMTTLREERAQFTAENGNFDANNPLALNLIEWKKKFNDELNKDFNRDMLYGIDNEITFN